MRNAAIAAVAVAAAAVAPSGAGAAPWPAQIAAAGFCVPRPEDGTFLPAKVGALGLGAPATKPVAVLDTGVDAGGPDLAGKVLPGVDAVNGGTADSDPDGHGTQLAGMIAGAGAGVLGVSPGSKILPVRIFAADRTTTSDIVAKGIGAAVQQGAGVILLSGWASASAGPAGAVNQVRAAINAAFAAGVIVVAAAGDTGDSGQTMPGGLPHVLDVSSANGLNLRSATANSGPWVDLIAPGEGLHGPLPLGLCNNGYGFSTGSDFAAAAAAAVAASIQALRPQLTTQQLFEVLRRGAVDLAATGRDDDTGFGFLDANTAKTSEPQPKETAPETDDDPMWVRGKYAKAHPALLTGKKLRFKATGSLSPTKDPADVFPVKLVKNERMVITLNSSDPNAALGMAILKSSAGDLDITNDVDDNIAAGTDGLSDYARLEITAKKPATYYIAIESSDPVDPDDPTAIAPAIVPYQLSGFAQIKHPKKPKKKSKRKKRR